MNLRDLDIPILQAPIPGADTVELAAAVSNAGGMGSLGMTWTQPEVASRSVEQLKAATSGRFFVNFVLAFPASTFDAVVEAGVPAVTLSWGHSPERVERAHRNGIAVGVQVGTADGATRAIRDGADFVICQGVEAGGHVQSTTPLATLLPQVVGLAQDVPVVAAGGLANGDDISWALGEGATAVMLGTRFVATKESEAHALYKEAIVKATAADTSYTLCFDGGWPHAAHRVLRNETLKRWESAGCPPQGSRPGEEDVIARTSSGEEVRRYSFENPADSTSGDVMDCCLYAGSGVEKITDVPNAEELVLRLWDECQRSGNVP